MAMTCRTSDGDMLDTICYHHYGTLVGTVEAVLAANESLGSELQPFRAGLQILLPDLPVDTDNTVSLWD